MKSRVVLDTNVVISGLLWKGVPQEILSAVLSGKLCAFTSEKLILELLHTLSKPKFSDILRISGFTPDGLVDRFQRCAVIVEPTKLENVVVLADPTDDAVIATALGANVDFIATGNGHLLTLAHSFPFRIIRPATLVRLLR